MTDTTAVLLTLVFCNALIIGVSAGAKDRRRDRHMTICLWTVA